MTRSWLALVLLLGACAGEKDTTDTPTETGDTDTTPACGNSLLTIHPEDGEGSAFFRTVVDAVTTVPDDTTNLIVTDSAGTEVPGTVMHEADRVYFVADDAFTPGETYTTELDWGCDNVTSTWTVGTGAGDPVDLSTVDGNTYLLDLRTGRFVSPTGIGDALQALIQVNLLLQTVDDGGSLTLVSGVAAEDDTQDECVPTVPFDQPADYTGNPWWVAEQDVLPLTVAGDEIDVQDLVLSAAFSPTGDALVGLSLDGIIDTRGLVESVAPGGGDDAVCNLFSATYGIDCEECPSGGTFCIHLVIDQFELPLMSYELAEITQPGTGCPTE